MTSGLAARLSPRGWLRPPRPTARLRLTVLYGALFLASGAVLLAITYLLVEKATAADATTLGGIKVLFGNPPRPVHSTVYTGQPGGVPEQYAQVNQLLAQATQQRAFDLHELLIWSAIALGFMVILSVVLGWLVAGRVLRPVRTISATARQISASSLDERLRLDGPDDEFRELATTLDDLLGRLEASFDSQRRFVASASHELRTPLTLDRALLERALRHRQPTQAFWRATCERLLVPASSRTT